MFLVLLHLISYANHVVKYHKRTQIRQTYEMGLLVPKISLHLLSLLCSSSVGSALPRRRCCAYITIGMICIFIGVGLTVSIIAILIIIVLFTS